MKSKEYYISLTLISCRRAKKELRSKVIASFGLKECTGISTHIFLKK